MEIITVLVKDEQTEVQVRLRKQTTMGALMNSYCERQQLPRDDVLFTLEKDGKVIAIEPDNTPGMLKLENNDIINVMV